MYLLKRVCHKRSFYFQGLYTNRISLNSVFFCDHIVVFKFEIRQYLSDSDAFECRSHTLDFTTDHATDMF